tara:strand:+ start:1530 stop:2579 length:1050 start_codon:yes stop_codon:yes gene_type:complete
MGYKQPKKTPMHGAPMYSKRDGSSMFGPSEYDAMQEGAAMKDTYVTKDGASEPITASIVGLKVLGKKLLAGLTKKKIAAAAKKAAVKGAANLAQKGIQKAMTPKEGEVPSGDTSPDTFSKASGGGGYASGGGMSMGPSKGGKINFGNIFQNIDLKGAGRKVKSTTGMLKNMAVDGIKTAASSELGKAAITAGATSAVGSLASRLMEKKQQQAQTYSTEAPTSHSYNAYGYAGGGGLSMDGASMPVNDSTHSHSTYKFQSGEGSENQSKLKGVVNNALNSFNRVNRPVNIDGKNFDLRNISMFAQVANSGSRSNNLKPVTQNYNKPLNIQKVSMDTTSSVLSKYAKEINK